MLHDIQYRNWLVFTHQEGILKLQWANLNDKTRWINFYTWTQTQNKCNNCVILTFQKTWIKPLNLQIKFWIFWSIFGRINYWGRDGSLHFDLIISSFLFWRWAKVLFVWNDTKVNANEFTCLGKHGQRLKV